TGIDFVAGMLDQARLRAKAGGLKIRFELGDAEEMPYPANSFDVVISVFGAIFTARPDQVAAEMLRPCRTGGRIVMANWTSEGLMGQLSAAASQYLPPKVMPSSLLWGEEDTVRRRLRIGNIQMTRRLMPIEFPMTPSEVVQNFRMNYPPAVKVFSSLDA